MPRRLYPTWSLFFWLVLLGHGSIEARAQALEPPTEEEVQAAESAPLFGSHELLALTIEADFHTIRREDRSDEDSEERPAVMRWTGSDGSSQTQDIQIQTRGNFRLSTRNCDFPPLRLNVKKGSVEGTIFENQDKLKMVVACKLGQEYWQQYVLAEYLVYRMFNLFTPLSFRVRLAHVTYVDSSGEDDPFTKYAFLIEDDDAMAARNGGVKVDWDTESGAQFNPVLLEARQAILVDVFQFMIGNTDWSGVEMHNMELFHRPPSTYAIIPYDFDFSGIIDTRYAIPDASLSLRSVRDRKFRGLCPQDLGRSLDIYEPIYQEFRDQKDTIYDLWRNLDGLEEDRVERTLDYLDDFFEILDDPRRIEVYMINQCRRVGGGRG
jgi:hypothetical protein